MILSLLKLYNSKKKFKVTHWLRDHQYIDTRDIVMLFKIKGNRGVG